jgi:YVTN family beta-propeller protein
MPPTTTPLTAPVSFNALYVINGEDDTISVINTETKAVAGTIAIQNAVFPHHIYLSPDKAKLAVSCPGMDMSGGHHGGMAGMQGAVLVLDALTGATLAGTMLPEMNHNAAWSPDGTEIWTSQMVDSGTVLVLNPADLSVKATIAVGKMPEEVSFSHDGHRAFVANGSDNTVSVIDVATKTVTNTIAVGQDPVGAWPGVDNRMYVTNETDKSITAIDAVTLRVLRTYALHYTPGMAATSPANDGTLWIANEDQGQVQINMTTMNMDMGDVVTGAGAHGVKFSDDGHTVYVTNQMANNVSFIDVASGNVTSTIDVGLKPNGLVFRTK